VSEGPVLGAAKNTAGGAANRTPGGAAEGTPGGAAEGRLANVSGALLLGGASRRMGSDKAHMEIDGEAAAVRLSRRLGTLFEEVLLVGGDPPAAARGRRVADPEGPRSALRGLVAALDAARSERVVVLATDLLGVTPDLLLALTAAPEADAVVPRTDAGAEPLCALYRREPVLAEARSRLAGDALALHALLDALDVTWLEGADLAALDPDGTALANLNTPEALAAFRAGRGT
jgi:molybdopterin-guanine dinucleotide biosynthesis protein A